MAVQNCFVALLIISISAANAQETSTVDYSIEASSASRADKPPKVSCSTTHDILKGATVWTNPSWPHSDVSKLDCSLTIKKTGNKVCFVRIIFENFTTAQPSEGKCTVDIMSLIYGSKSTEFCGEENVDIIKDAKGVSNQVFFHIIQWFSDGKDNISLRFTTNSTRVTRKWRIRVEPIACELQKRYEGCRFYETVRETSLVMKSFNFPHSMINGLRFRDEDYFICFGKRERVDSRHEERNSVQLIPSNNGLSKILTKAFSLDAANGDFSRHNEDCKVMFIELLKRTNGKNSKFCGGYFNSKAKLTKDVPVSFETDMEVPRIRWPKVDKFLPGGFRFELKFPKEGVYKNRAVNVVKDV